jgi:hypothetical protein
MTEGAVIFLRIIFGLGGIMCIVFAYVIGAKQRFDLIAGYNHKPEKCKDPVGLAKFMGIWIFIVGIFTGIYPWIYGPERTRPLLWVLYFCIPVVVIAVIMNVGSKRYEHKATK